LKLDRLKEKKELVSTALLVISVLSAILILVKVTGFFVASANAESAVKDAIRHSAPDAKNVTAQLDKSKKVADALKKSNLFSPPLPKQNPIKTVMGIFGDEALINGKWYKAGDKVADARILAVNPTSVETEWDGKKKTFSPIDSGAASGPGGSSRSRRSTVSVRSSSSSSGGRPQMVVTKSSAGAKSPAANNPEAMKMKKKYEGMSEAQKNTFKRVMKDRAEQYKQMSDSERKNFKPTLWKESARAARDKED
jgi:hypothetical protein